MAESKLASPSTRHVPVATTVAGPSIVEVAIEASRSRSRSLPSVFDLIPAMVRSRIPNLPSIRRSARRRSRFQPLRITSPIPESERIQDLGSSRSNSSASSRTQSPERMDALTSISPNSNISDTRSGINWETYSAGLQLSLNARAQAMNNPNADPATLRSMSIDAVRYMHMALPPNLSDAEVSAITSSLPQQVRVQRTTTTAISNDVRITQRQPPPDTFLRRGVSHIVCIFVALVAMLVPHLLRVLRAGLEYERRHQIAQKLFANGIIVTDVMSDNVAQALVQFGNGRIGESLTGAGHYLMDGVLGGLNDGLNELQKQAPGVSGV